MSTAANGPGRLHPASYRTHVKRILSVRPRRSWLGLTAGLGVPVLLIGALAWPMLFTDRAFNPDWENHLWYMWHQSLAIRANHFPSLYLDYSGGVFYPFYAFYGGTLYALVGALSLVLGDAPLKTYILSYLLGFAAAYGGWYWMARMSGLGGWLAHVPGLIFISSAPYLTMVYGLGDWTEFIAVSVMPLMVASVLSVLMEPQLRIWPAIALVGSSILFFGSHLLTVIWGTTILLLLSGAASICLPEVRRKVGIAGVIRVMGLVGPALLVSAWFLLPAVAYESQTTIAQSYPHFRHLLQTSMYPVATRHLFTLSSAKIPDTVLTLALPVLTIAWVIASLAILLWTRRRGQWMSALLLLMGSTVSIGVLMTHAGLILALPRIYATLQFSFRLESYLLMGVSGALLLALVLTGEGGGHMRRWRWLLAPIAMVSLFGALRQIDTYKGGGNRSAALASYSIPLHEQEGLLNYVDDRLPFLRTPLPQLSFPSSTEPHGYATGKTHLERGSRVDTNLRASPDLVHMNGARIIATDPQANDVLEIISDAGASPSTSKRDRDPSNPGVRVAVGPANRLPVVAGRILTILGLVVLVVELGIIVARRNRVRRVDGKSTI